MITHKLSKEENNLLLDILEEVLSIEDSQSVRDLYKRLGGKITKVVIEVKGGFAEVTQSPDDIEVEIIDHDIEGGK